MTRPVVRVVIFRMRAGLRRNATAYIALILMIAVLGGVAMAAIAVARRTQSSFPSYFRGTNPSDLFVLDTASTSNGTAASNVFANTLRQLPDVRRVGSWGTPNVLLLDANGVPLASPSSDPNAEGVFVLASADGLYTAQDRLTAVSGRLPGANAAEMVTDAVTAKALGLSLGQTTRMGFYSPQQSASPGYGTSSVKPLLDVEVKLVGIVVFNDAVVRDDIDQQAAYVVLGPGIVQRLQTMLGSFGGVFAGVQVDHAANVSTVEAEINTALPQAAIVSVAASRVAKAERAIAPESLLLGLFGAIAALAAALIAGQMIARQVQRETAELNIVRSLGGSRSMLVCDAGILGAIAAGALGAAVLAIALSPLGPIGPVRAVARGRGIHADWTVLALGVMWLLVVPLVVYSIVALRAASRGRARQSRSRRSSRLASAASHAGASPSITTGVRFAMEPAGGDNAAPLRSAMLGVVLASGVVLATTVFGSSLSSLVSHPSLYGWNWDVEVQSGYGGVSNIPAAKADTVLRGDSDVAAWTGAYFATAQLDGLTVPVLGIDPGADPGPSMLSGHEATDASQIVLGATTLAQLHKHVGDTVEMSSGSAAGVALVIAGTAALPTAGVATSLHTDLAVGAVIPASLIPADQLGLGEHDGPEAYFVRFRGGRTGTEKRLKQLMPQLTTDADGHVTVLGVQRPAEIINYRNIGAVPSALGLVLSLGAAVALALTLIASVRRRRRDLAVLRTLGFTTRQLLSVVMWQSVVVVAIGTAIGIPIGVIAGRTLWIRFADAIHVVPRPTVSGVTLLFVALGAVVLAALAATVPAPRVARTSTAVLLRAE